MAYEKLNLTDGTVLNEEHLAHIEDGIVCAAGFAVNSAVKDTGETVIGYTTEEDRFDTYFPIVRFDSQSIPATGQAQARKNIRCGSVGEVSEDSKASGEYAHAEGHSVDASGQYAHCEGHGTTATGQAAHSEGWGSDALYLGSHAEGWASRSSAIGSHAEGSGTRASRTAAHAEGNGTVADGAAQHVEGRYNVIDAPDSYNMDAYAKYAHIVGNGTSKDARSNAHTLDWDGNAWYAGYVEGTALILPSPNGTRWRITVDDTGTLAVAAVTEE